MKDYFEDKESEVFMKRLAWAFRKLHWIVLLLLLLVVLIQLGLRALFS